MALTATRIDYRIALSDVDRGIEHTESLIVAQHPSETRERVTLRVLAWCLLYEERLVFGPGLSSRDSADIWTHDLTGRITTWAECATADAEELRRAMQQNGGVAAHALFSSKQRRDALLVDVNQWKRMPKDATLAIWLIDEALVKNLAGLGEKRQSWTVTIAGEHLYIDAGGTTVDGAVECMRW